MNIAPLKKTVLHLVFTTVTLCGAVNQAVAQPPQRVVSLDYCADQYVIQLIPRQHIVGVSPDATRRFSYLRHQARGLPVVRPVAEDIVVLKPDLIVRSYGGGATALKFFADLGIEVVQLGYANRLSQVRQNILDAAAQLRAVGKGRALVREMDKRLQDIADQAAQRKDNVDVLYMTPSGVTSGTGTLVDDMITAAALKNFQAKPGWHALPLERLAYESPGMVALAFFAALTNHTNVWSAIHHPVARRQHQQPASVRLNGAWTACGGWFLLDAVEALHEAAGQFSKSGGPVPAP